MNTSERAPLQRSLKLPEETGGSEQGNANAELLPGTISQEVSNDVSEANSQVEVKASYTDVEKEAMMEEYVTPALEDGLLAINSYKIKRECPLAYALMKEYMIKRAGFPNLDDDTIIGALLYTPRNVIYDFLDNNGQFLNIHGAETTWKYTFDPNESFGPFTSRVRAESEGFVAGLARLEVKLQKT